MRKAEILLVLLVGLIPFLWYKPGFIIAKGDYFPYIFDIKNFFDDFHLWSTNNLGSPSLNSAFLLYGSLWGFSQYFTFDTGFWQVVLQSAYFLAAAFSMLFLAKLVYPEQKYAAIIATVFYIFNFFILSILLNIGMMWTYAFLPLLIALLIKVITQVQEGYSHIICFAISFSAIASISSINFADIALLIISLGSILFYYGVLERKVSARQLVKTLTVLLIVTSLLSVWWLVPNLNYYLFSASTQLQQQVNVLSWSWTHARASFLNLFWLNGGWGWLPEYSPYYNIISNNAVLSLLLFLPFLLASAALFFKGKTTKFNSYIMLMTLGFTFLAKGIHEPFGFLNLFLYNNVPYMNMFREPVSKFTLIMIPFLALLIGFSIDRIAKILAQRKSDRSNLHSKLFTLSAIFVLLIAIFPMFTNPIETKTEQIPYSTYVEIPQYWLDASEWLSSKRGDFKILVTPLDDHYQVPYSWGYFGTDSFIERLIQKPVIGPFYASSYEVDLGIMNLMQQLGDAIRYNRTEEFETIISLMNVRYILQRNDPDYDYLDLANRDMLNLERMEIFLSNQPNILLVKSIGKLDIYEYTNAKPYIHIFESKQFQEFSIEMKREITSTTEWKFDSKAQLNEWKNTTLRNQFSTLCELYLKNNSLKFELWNSTWGWKIIASPLIPGRYESKYNFALTVKGENAHGVHIKILEYDSRDKMTHGESVIYVADGTFNWKNVQVDYVPRIQNTTFLQLQIWNGHQTDKPFPNIIWIDNVKIQGYMTTSNMARILEELELSQNNTLAIIEEYARPNPTKIIVKVHATQPFILAINEAHDPNWKAHLKARTQNSIPIFSVMNGFQINETGHLEIIIEYEPQKWFNMGVVLSFISLVMCLAYLTYANKKIKSISRILRTRMQLRRKPLDTHKA